MPFGLYTVIVTFKFKQNLIFINGYFLKEKKWLISANYKIINNSTSTSNKKQIIFKAQTQSFVKGFAVIRIRPLVIKTMQMSLQNFPLNHVNFLLSCFWALLEGTENDPNLTFEMCIVHVSSLSQYRRLKPNLLPPLKKTKSKKICS